jgi:DNA-directed RNA polymerase subunit RPC12/RpoP
MEKEIVKIGDIYPYNEYDADGNGGFFNCPNCDEQLYVKQTDEDTEYECDCGCNIVFKH